MYYSTLTGLHSLLPMPFVFPVLGVAGKYTKGWGGRPKGMVWAELSADWARDIVRRPTAGGFPKYFTSTYYYHPETVSGRLFAL